MFDILDQAQLIRIEATHRGFLYQHLYAVGCILLAPASGATALLVERDEDIELLFPDRHNYIQVKSRMNPLRMSDIKSAIERMAQIRALHQQGTRSSTPHFWIVTNSVPGPELLRDISTPDWPADITVVWPGQPPNPMSGLPPAWSNLPDALEWCTKEARTIPYSRVPADTLTWKLAALIHFACTGAPPREQHRINAADLPDLFEQILIQLQDFPEPPPLYRPHEAEPDYQQEKTPRVRMVVGLSGAGKTAWATQLALHVGSSVAYYSITQGVGVSIAAGLARELAARFFGADRESFIQALLPGISGLESLRAVDLALAERHLGGLVVLDNIHFAIPDEIRDIVTATSNINFVFLSQFGANQREIAAWLGVESETLSGWSIDTIAAEFAAAGVRIDPQTTLRIQRLTSGLPLYVQSAVRLISSRYNGNTEHFCAELEEQIHIERTEQELILARVFQNLPTHAQNALALLSIADVPLTRDEVTQILTSSLEIDDRRIAHALRSLGDYGIVQQTRDQHIVIHDAFRVIGVDHQLSLDNHIVQAARMALKNMLRVSFTRLYTPRRMSLYLRLLAVIGDSETLVDLAGYEHLHEQGHFIDMRTGLEAVVATTDFTAQNRFWALDALASNDFQSGNLDQMEQRLPQMEQLLPETENGLRERLSLLMKHMLVESRRNGYVPIAKYIDTIHEHVRGNPELTRIFRYNYAVSMYYAGFYRQIQREVFDLVMEYFDVLGLHYSQIYAKNAPEIAALLQARQVDLEDAKRTADSLHLLALCMIKQGKKSGLALIHAVKFYQLAGAYSSLVKVGQDVADEFLGILRDPALARSFIEDTLLPVIEELQLMQYVVPVRAQYAVILAYCGEGAAATGELERLGAFYESLPPDGRAEFDQQRALIGEILEGRRKLPSPAIPILPGHLAKDIAAVAKDASCPCGSGKKYRNCHGRGRSVPSASSTSKPALPVAQTGTGDFELAFHRYVESIGGRDELLKQNMQLIANNGQPCDVITRSRQRYIDVRIHHNLIASFMYGIRRATDLPDRITLVKDSVLVAQIRPRDVWIMNPMPEQGFTEAELREVDISEGNRRAANGLTLRQMIRDSYGCKNEAELDYFLRRFLAS